MKTTYRCFCLILGVVMLFTGGIVEARAKAESDPTGIASENPFYTDHFTVEMISEDLDGSRSTLLGTPIIIFSSPSTGVLQAYASIDTNTTVYKVGYTSMVISRWNGSYWVHAASWIHQYSYNTDFFSNTKIFSTATSGTYYRVRVAFYADRIENAGDTDSTALTSDFIICR